LLKRTRGDAAERRWWHEALELTAYSPPIQPPQYHSPSIYGQFVSKTRGAGKIDPWLIGKEVTR
ncbi:MAG: hypothetical protein VB026_06870, partial [Anaerolineaceae bacterium]|nr:hypothetical protein [Anaerolineaceae bacterium]